MDTPDRALELAIAQLDKQFGKGSVMRLGTEEIDPWPAISTGAMSLDVALGIGGLPRGRIVEIFGMESSGKSTICLSVMAQAQMMGELAAYIDVEHALDPNYAKALGVNLDELLLSQPSCAEEALEILLTLVGTGSLGIVVVDSVAALTPRAELEGDMDSQQMGLQARLMGKAMRKLVARASETKTLVIFTNQIRQKIGLVFGNPETTPGGMALKFYSSVRIDLRKKEDLKDKEDGSVKGVKVKAKVVKNKMAPPLRVTEFDIVYAKGVNTLGCIVDLAIESGVLRKGGAWLSWGEDTFAQGRDKAIDVLTSDLVLAGKMKAEVLAKLALL